MELKNGMQENAAAPSEAVRRRNKRLYYAAKRAFDVVCSGLAMVVLSPVFLLISLIIVLDSKGPAFFVHRRIGHRGKEIYIYKFRTMVLDAEKLIQQFTPEQHKEWEENFKLDHDPRITRVGSILRKTSLDELPQLLNIFKGDLSIVGPRPVIEHELEKYGENKEKFLSVIPGLTGYWQAYARSDCSYEQRMKMELDYIDNANMLWDLKIIFATVGTVLKGKGAK